MVRHWVGHGLIAAGSFAATALLVRAAPAFLPSVDIYYPLTADDYEGLGRTRSGPELLMVFLGSPECAYSTAEMVSDNLNSLKTSLQRQAHEAGYSFATLAIAKTSRAAEGMRYLRRSLSTRTRCARLLMRSWCCA